MKFSCEQKGMAKFDIESNWSNEEIELTWDSLFDNKEALLKVRNNKKLSIILTSPNYQAALTDIKICK